MPPALRAPGIPHPGASLRGLRLRLRRSALSRCTGRPTVTDCSSVRPQRPYPQTNDSAARRRRQSPRPASRVLACRRRLAKPQRPRPPLAPAAQPARRKLAWPALMRRWAAMLAAPSAARNAERFVRPGSLTPQCERAPPTRMPSVRPGTRCARPGAGEGRRGEREGDGTAQAPPSACVVSTSLVVSSLRLSPVPCRGLFCHSGCVRRSHNPTICKACSLSGLVQAFRRPGAFTPLRSVALHIAGLCDPPPGLTPGAIDQRRANQRHRRRAATSMGIRAALPRQ